MLVTHEIRACPVGERIGQLKFYGTFLLLLYEITAYDNFLSLSFIMFSCFSYQTNFNNVSVTVTMPYTSKLDECAAILGVRGNKPFRKTLTN